MYMVVYASVHVLCILHSLYLFTFFSLIIFYFPIALSPKKFSLGDDDVLSTCLSKGIPALVQADLIIV